MQLAEEFYICIVRSPLINIVLCFGDVVYLGALISIDIVTVYLVLESFGYTNLKIKGLI